MNRELYRRSAWDLLYSIRRETEDIARVFEAWDLVSLPDLRSAWPGGAEGGWEWKKHIVVLSLPSRHLQEISLSTRRSPVTSGGHNNVPTLTATSLRALLQCIVPATDTNPQVVEYILKEAGQLRDFMRVLKSEYFAQPALVKTSLASRLALSCILGNEREIDLGFFEIDVGNILAVLNDSLASCALESLSLSGLCADDNVLTTITARMPRLKYLYLLGDLQIKPATKTALLQDRQDLEVFSSEQFSVPFQRRKLIENRYRKEGEKNMGDDSHQNRSYRRPPIEQIVCIDIDMDNCDITQEPLDLEALIGMNHKHNGVRPSVKVHCIPVQS